MDAETLKAEVQELIQLFETELSGLKFPDLDAKVLSEALGRARDRHLQVAQAEAALQAARASFETERDAVRKKAQRTIAYLRVYAENDESLLAKIEALALSAGTGRASLAERPAEGTAAPRRRGRPKKAAGPELMFEGGNVTPISLATEEEPAAAVG